VKEVDLYNILFVCVGSVIVDDFSQLTICMLKAVASHHPAINWCFYGEFNDFVCFIDL